RLQRRKITKGQTKLRKETQKLLCGKAFQKPVDKLQKVRAYQHKITGCKKQSPQESGAFRPGFFCSLHISPGSGAYLRSSVHPAAVENSQGRSLHSGI